MGKKLKTYYWPEFSAANIVGNWVIYIPLQAQKNICKIDKSSAGILVFQHVIMT